MFVYAVVGSIMLPRLRSGVRIRHGFPPSQPNDKEYEGKTMSRIFARVLMVGLLSLPATAFAFTGSVYPTRPDVPDIDVSGITGTSAGSAFTDGSALTLTGTAEYLRDVPGTYCNPDPCDIFPTLTFAADATGFSITGENQENTASITYLAGSFAGGYAEDGVEFGELFKVTEDNVAEWSEIEYLYGIDAGPQGATNMLNETVFFDFDATAKDGDMEPFIPTPEPATLTLLCTGLAAGLLRKRRARKKA